MNTTALIGDSTRKTPGRRPRHHRPGHPCVPSRLIPYGENVQLRLKVEPGVREAVAWYCDCDALVHSIEIAPGIVQDAYLAAVHAFNASPRTCPRCAQLHPPAELGDIAWNATATAIRASLR